MAKHRVLGKRNQRATESIRRALTEVLEARTFLTSVVVNTTADSTDPSGSSIISLRDAVAIANASTSPTSITFDSTVFGSSQTITLTQATRLILENPSEPITVTGPSAPLTISGGGKTGIFVVQSGTSATISNLTLIDGYTGNGSGIDSYGNTTASNLTITGGKDNYGGAIFNSGTLSLSDSTLAGNSATYGGGVSNAAGGTATLINDTITGNTATYGGGVANGLSNEAGTTHLYDDTIAANSAPNGGGIDNYSGDTVTLGNTIVADNGSTSSSAVGLDVDGTFTSAGFNLISRSTGGTGWVSSDLTGTSESPLNPKLAALGNYGGSEQTIFPLSGSPAIGAGSTALIPAGVTTDERGLPRTNGGNVDIGAVEVQTSNVSPTSPLTPIVPFPYPAPVALGPGSATSPGPVLTTNTPTFQWNAVTGVSGMTGYQINLYDSTAGKSYSYQVGTSVTSYTLPSSAALTAGHSYVWNVRIIVGNATGAPSTYYYFQAPAAVSLPAPVATGPGSTAKPGTVLTTSTPTLTWNAVTGVSGMTGYLIYLTDLTASKTVSYTVGTSVTSYTVPSGVLTAGDDFVWDVRITTAAQNGPPSTYLYFQAPPATTTTLPAPVATGPGSTTSPGTVLTTTTPTFQWQAVTGVSGLTGYQINLYDSTAGKSFSYQVGASVDSYTLPAGVLTAGDKYVWNVRILVGSQSGPPSTYLYFQAPPAVTLPAPVATGPGSSAKPGPVLTTTTPTLTWNAVTGVTGLTGYQIYLTDETASKTYSYQTGASVTSFTVPTALASGDVFVWDVRVITAAQDGPPSTYLYFQTPAAVTTTLPAPVVIGPGSTTAPGTMLTTTTPTFQWQAVTGVTNLTGYQINLYDSTAGKSYSYQLGASVDSYTLPAGVLTNGHSYVWNVRVLAGNQSGPPSTYLYFQAPAAVALPAPVATGPGSTEKPGTLLTTATPTLSWNAITGVTNQTGYLIYLTDLTAGKTFSYTVGTSVTSFTVPPGTLVAGDDFVWDVRITTPGQNGPPSTYLYFQTPSSVSGANPTTPAQLIVADTTKLTHLESEQHATARSLKATVSGSKTYAVLLARYKALKKRIKTLKTARAALESQAP
jgi:hypothetical protein